MIQIVCSCLIKTCIMKLYGIWFFVFSLFEIGNIFLKKRENYFFDLQKVILMERAPLSGLLL